MAYKLYFRYGTMNSSKTANLLMVAFNYKEKGRKVLLLKPKIDDRFGSDNISSRCAMSCKADFVIDKTDHTLRDIDINVLATVRAILVDEVQFFTRSQINALRELTQVCPVICYGLRTDYKSNLFEGSKRLMEIADSIEEIKTICSFCSKKAIINLKHKGNQIIKSGSDEPDIGDENKYLSSCWFCWDTNSIIPL